MPVDDSKTAAAYIRVSTEEQTEYSPDAQLAEIRKFANKEGFIIPDKHIYIDAGITGRQTAKRAAFNRMIGTAKTKPKPFDAILLWKYSRFARNREDAVVYKSMLRKQLGIDVLSISEPVGDDKMSVLIEALIEAMDEYYSINLAEEVKRGMTEKARRGELQTSASFGYRLENRRLVPEAEEAAFIKQIFDRFIAGNGLFSIAKGLNEIGARTHRGNRFDNRTIEYILRNPVYIGKLRWNPSGKTRRDFANENIILADASHEPIIDVATWQQVQKQMSEMKARWKYHKRPVSELKEWPGGIVRCATCNATLVFAKPHYFKCNNYAKGRCLTSQHIYTELIKDAIIERLEHDRNAWPPPPFKMTRAAAGSGDELRHLRQSLELVDKKKRRLHEAFLAGADTAEEYKVFKEKLQADAVSIINQIIELENASESTYVAEKLKDAITNTLEILRSPVATKTDKHNAADKIIESCTFDKAKYLLTITYRFYV